MLDPDQYTAAHSEPRRPLLILAHAGTGKTRTLVERLALLQQARQAGLFGARSGGTIAVLTFTRAAQRELGERLTSRIGEEALAGYTIQTFHALGLALYRGGWARAYEHRPRLQVATRGQAERAAAEALRSVGLHVPPWQATRLIADAKLGWPLRAVEAGLLARALAAHDELLAARGLLHVHDLLVRPVQMLAALPALRREVCDRFCCVVGDEAQDWSPYQAALFAYLAGPKGYATACGDARQAIFGGSSPRFLLEFARVFPAVRVITLRTTYRLTAPLLKLSRAIATPLPGGTIVGLCRRPDGPLPLVHIARTRTEEAAWIAAYLQHLRTHRLLARWGDAVVLVRTRAQCRVLALALRDAGLPVHSGGHARHQDSTLAGMMAWLVLLRDPDDGAALLRTLDTPPRGLQRTEPRSLRQALALSGPWTIERLCREAPTGLSDWQRRELGAFLRLYHSLHTLAAVCAPVVLFDALLERTGIAAWLHAKGAGRAENIAALRTVLAHEGDLGLLDHALMDDPIDAETDAVWVHTIHSFKGREAEAVVVAGVEEGLLPHPAVLRAGLAGLEEELRTFYVACTRARTHEAITAAWHPEPGQRGGGPSRLFHLIDPTLVRVA